VVSAIQSIVYECISKYIPTRGKSHQIPLLAGKSCRLKGMIGRLLHRGSTVFALSILHRYFDFDRLMIHWHCQGWKLCSSSILAGSLCMISLLFAFSRQIGIASKIQSISEYKMLWVVIRPNKYTRRATSKANA